MKGASAARRLRYRIRMNANTDLKIQTDILERLTTQDRRVDAFYEPAVLVKQSADPECYNSKLEFNHEDLIISEVLSNNGICDYQMYPGCIGSSNWVEPVFPMDYIQHPDCDPTLCSRDVPCDLCQEASYEHFRKQNIHPVPQIVKPQTTSVEAVLDHEVSQHGEVESPGTTEGFITPSYLPFEDHIQQGAISVPSLTDDSIDTAHRRVALADDPYRLLQLLSDVEFLSVVLPVRQRRIRYTSLRKKIRNKICLLLVQLFKIPDSCSCTRRWKRRDDPTCIDDFALKIANHLTPYQTNRPVVLMIRHHILQLCREIHRGHYKT